MGREDAAGLQDVTQFLSQLTALLNAFAWLCSDMQRRLKNTLENKEAWGELTFLVSGWGGVSTQVSLASGLCFH